MSRRGTFYAITPDEAERLLSLVGNDSALAKESQELFSFERQRAHFITPVDKTWDPMHRCLTDGTIRGLGKGATPLALCVLGGRSLHGGDELIVCFTAPEQVPQVSQALDEIEIQWFVSRFTNLPSTGYSGPINNEEFQFLWEYFTSVRNLYSKAAEANRAVVFVAD
jgi:hypothetical protein